MKKSITAQGCYYFTDKNTKGDAKILEIKIGNKQKKIWIIGTKELRERKHQLKMAIMPPIFRLCAKGFEIEKADKAFSADVQRHIMGEENIGIIMEKEMGSLSTGNFKEKKNRPIAFISYRLIKAGAGKDALCIIYFSAVMVAQEYRGQGIAKNMMRAIMQEHDARWLTLRTQNPVMRESVKGACNESYPSLSGQLPPAEFIEVGKLIADILGMKNYDHLQMIEKGTYGKMLYGKGLPTLDEQMTSDAPFINRAFGELLDVSSGGSMIIVGRDIKE